MHLICHLQMHTVNRPLPNNAILDKSKLESFAEDKTNVKQKSKFAFGKGRKHCGKRRKFLLPAFSPLPTMFSKAYFLRVVQSRYCLEKS